MQTPEQLAESLPLTFRNVEPFSPGGKPPPGAPEWIWEVDHPYLHGLFAPVSSEMQAADLVVEQGNIPEDLYGMYVVNGPSQRFKPATRYHYYDGDGMLNAITFKDGKASYNSRWVQTFELQEEMAAGHNIWPGLAGPFRPDLPHSPIKDSANTDIIFYAGRLLALWYLAGTPYRIDPRTLATLGAENFDGRLDHNLSAHSKVDPNTGELLFFHYQDTAPYMRYGLADADGNLVLDQPIDLPGPRAPHDMGVTTNYAILHDLPYFQDDDILRQHNRRVVRFHPDVPARFGILPRRGGDVRWFEAEPCYLLHVVNAWEEGNEVVMVGCRQPNPGGRRDKSEAPLTSQLAVRRRVHVLHQWRFDLATGKTRERQLDDLNTEFPTINRLFLGRPSRYGYLQYLPLPADDGSITGRCQTFDALIKYDTSDGSLQRYDYGARCSGSETHFAPRRGATADMREDDGYLVTYVHDGNDWVSRCLIFDARDISKGPVATVRMPRRFNIGFHAMWVRGEEMAL